MDVIIPGLLAEGLILVCDPESFVLNVHDGLRLVNSNHKFIVDSCVSSKSVREIFSVSMPVIKKDVVIVLLC